MQEKTKKSEAMFSLTEGKLHIDFWSWEVRQSETDMYKWRPSLRRWQLILSLLKTWIWKKGHICWVLRPGTMPTAEQKLPSTCSFTDRQQLIERPSPPHRGRGVLGLGRGNLCKSGHCLHADLACFLQQQWPSSQTLDDAPTDDLVSCWQGVSTCVPYTCQSRTNRVIMRNCDCHPFVRHRAAFSVCCEQDKEVGLLFIFLLFLRNILFSRVYENWQVLMLGSRCACGWQCAEMLCISPVISVSLPFFPANWIMSQKTFQLF